MATAAATLPRRPATATRGRWRGPLAFAGLIGLILLLWEGSKFLGGTPWRPPGLVPSTVVLWDPPFRWAFANDLNLPHIWNIGLVFLEPWQRGADRNVAQFLFDAALYTWREAFLGLRRSGRSWASGLATLFVHSRWLERSFVPYVVASQTIPIIALAPMIVFALGAERDERRRHRHVPDVLPGDDRDDPRPALVRSAGHGADALLRRVAQPDLLEAAAAGIAAVPVRGAQDRRDREHRRGDHRRGPGRHQRRPGPGHPDVQPVLHHRPREALGGDHRHRPPRASSSTCSSASPSTSSCAGGPGSPSDDRSTWRPARHDRVHHADPSSACTASARPSCAATTRRPSPSQAIDLDIAQGEFVSLIGPSGLRQVHAPARHRRPHPADRRTRSWSTASRPPGRASIATTGWSSRRRSCSSGGTWRATSSCRWRSSAGPSAERKARAKEMLDLVDLGGVRRPQPEPALGRHAAARGDRPGPGVRARPAAHGRAVRGARRDDPRADELRGPADLGADRDDDRVRDPLHPGGGVPVVPRRRHERPAGPDHEGHRHRPARARVPRTRARIRATSSSSPRSARPSAIATMATARPAWRRPRGPWPRASSGECRDGRPGRSASERRPDAAARPGASSGGGHPRRRSPCSSWSILLWEFAIGALGVKAFILPKPSRDRRRPPGELEPRASASGRPPWRPCSRRSAGSSSGPSPASSSRSPRRAGCRPAMPCCPWRSRPGAIPIIAFAPLMNNWFGVLSPLSKMMMAAVLVFFPVMANVTRGLTQVEPSALELMRSYAASDTEVLRKVRDPERPAVLLHGPEARDDPGPHRRDRRRVLRRRVARPGPDHRPERELAEVRCHVGRDHGRGDRRHRLLPDRGRRRTPGHPVAFVGAERGVVSAPNGCIVRRSGWWRLSVRRRSRRAGTTEEIR